MHTEQKEAKLGEQNKFIYDKERGIWREEGAEVPAAAAPLPPPPMARKAPDSGPASMPGEPRGAKSDLARVITNSVAQRLRCSWKSQIQISRFVSKIGQRNALTWIRLEFNKHLGPQGKCQGDSRASLSVKYPLSICLFVL